MKNYDMAYCPLTKSGCAAQCQLNCDGKCALMVISERMVDVVTAINDIKWAIIDATNNH